jgi:hypothetical protein
MQGTYMPNMKAIGKVLVALWETVTKVWWKKSIISLGDLDPSDLKPIQKVEVHARYLPVLVVYVIPACT